MSTVRCFPITSGAHAGQTFIQWTGNFSSDADAGNSLFNFYQTKLEATNICSLGVMEDAKFKRREALADLAKAVGK